MLKKISFLFLLLCTLASCNSGNSSKQGYLLVILSNYGKIQKAPNGQFQLVLDHGAVENVVAFTNRPNRTVKQITAEQLANAWSQGPNSFEKDPPNATVIINQKLQTIVIQSIEVFGDQTVFTIQSDGSHSLFAINGVTQLFIDWICAGPPITCEPIQDR